MPTLREILEAFEDPDRRSELEDRLESADPATRREALASLDVLERMFGGLRAAGGRVRDDLRDAVRRLGDAADAAAGPRRRPEFAAAVGPGAEAFRGAPPTEFHELYRCGSIEVDVAWLEDGTLLGQLAGEGEDLEDAVTVLYGASRPRQVAVDGAGDFEFERVGAGRYELVVETRSTFLVLPELTLVRER